MKRQVDAEKHISRLHDLLQDYRDQARRLDTQIRECQAALKRFEEQKRCCEAIITDLEKAHQRALSNRAAYLSDSQSAVQRTPDPRFFKAELTQVLTSEKLWSLRLAVLATVHLARRPVTTEEIISALALSPRLKVKAANVRVCLSQFTLREKLLVRDGMGKYRITSGAEARVAERLKKFFD